MIQDLESCQSLDLLQMENDCRSKAASNAMVCVLCDRPCVMLMSY